MTDTLNPATDAAASAIDRSAADVVADLTLEEKASLTSGASFWTTKPLERVGLPAIMLTDGPHGVRKQRASADHLGIGDSVPATCFPPAVALGSSFDPELLERVGVALGEESQAERVGVLLGPGINIKRSPLCGRNFEYLSEDPIVSGVLGSALVRGLQSQGVGASLKHFAANNQEADRMRVSADIDERPLREIYLRGFQRVVEDEQPWTVMCSYNRLNGVYTSEDPWLLTKVLRDEWGFDGLVVSDWGAVNERITGLAAGLDLEMPSSEGRTDAQLVAAVRSGVLDERLLDTAARRNVELVQKAVRGARADAAYDADAHHALAREVAGASIVLLKNDDAVLPLAAGPTGSAPPSPSSASWPARRATRAPDPRRSTPRVSTTRSTRSARSPVPRCRSRPATATTVRSPTSSWPKRWPRHPLPGPCCSSSACPQPSSPRASTATTSSCPPRSSRSPTR